MTMRTAISRMGRFLGLSKTTAPEPPAPTASLGQRVDAVLSELTYSEKRSIRTPASGRSLKPQKHIPHDYDDQTPAQAILRCIDRNDWEILTDEELGGLLVYLNRLPYEDTPWVLYEKLTAELVRRER